MAPSRCILCRGCNMLKLARCCCCTDVSSPEQIFDIMAAGFEHRAVGCHDVRHIGPCVHVCQVYACGVIP